jgi:hypothetical protein
VLSNDAFTRMSRWDLSEDENDAYGYGLLLRELDGRRYVGHGGGMVGYLAGLQADPVAGLGVIVLQNGMGARPMTLARTVIRIADGEPEQPPAAGAPTPGFAGVYEPDSSGGERIEILSSESAPLLRHGGTELALEELDEDLFLAPDAAFDKFPLRVERTGDVIWHGGSRYVRAGTAVNDLPKPSPELQAIVGHYRSHNPWTTNFRIVLRGDRPWLIFPAAPDGFETEAPLLPSEDGTFRVGEDPGNPELVSFDTVVDGAALRAWLSGWPYYRA